MTAQDSSTAQFLRDEIAAKYKLPKSKEEPSKTGLANEQSAKVPSDTRGPDTKVVDYSKRLRSKIQVKATPSEITEKAHRIAPLIGKKRPKRVAFSH